MKAIIGKKIGMTQIFDENGYVIPVTAIEAGPCVVAQVKSEDTDGYNAIQLGFGDVKLMAALGFLFGIKNILVITLVSFFIGAIIGVIVMIAKRKEKEEYIAFGPFIVIGAVTLMFVGADKIIEIFIAFCSTLGLYMTDAIYFLMEKFK